MAERCRGPRAFTTKSQFPASRSIFQRDGSLLTGRLGQHLAKCKRSGVNEVWPYKWPGPIHLLTVPLSQNIALSLMYTWLRADNSGSLQCSALRCIVTIRHYLFLSHFLTSLCVSLLAIRVHWACICSMSLCGCWHVALSMSLAIPFSTSPSPCAFIKLHSTLTVLSLYNTLSNPKPHPSWLGIGPALRRTFTELYFINLFSLSFLPPFPLESLRSEPVWSSLLLHPSCTIWLERGCVYPSCVRVCVCACVCVCVRCVKGTLCSSWIAHVFFFLGTLKVTVSRLWNWLAVHEINTIILPQL